MNIEKFAKESVKTTLEKSHYYDFMSEDETDEKTLTDAWITCMESARGVYCLLKCFEDDDDPDVIAICDVLRKCLNDLDRKEMEAES